MFAAYDAGLDRPQEVTADALRYTYLSFLHCAKAFVLRISNRIVRIPAEQSLSPTCNCIPPRARRSIKQIERLLPALTRTCHHGIG